MLAAGNHRQRGKQKQNCQEAHIFSRYVGDVDIRKKRSHRGVTDVTDVTDVARIQRKEWKMFSGKCAVTAAIASAAVLGYAAVKGNREKEQEVKQARKEASVP
ncbi:hypothetical protein RIU96_06700 [Corynebacterium sp. Z-1]|nr:hypothetical protein [Corynebacterium sp. Z-1]TVS28350.1 hypothetical protein EKI56_00845 [Corynebacterium sanguinis]WNI11932.1 hypothetical protein RIU96_06700 [Corynebacterium sp. Z-1]